ncbi:MAG TPA: asparagine synthetase B family protein [Deltaproteobacteria bacterium]|nr:asparagine synthetase B family protein [Deltaproteobacteria bacterium]
MSDLLGAWSLSRAPIEELLDATAQQRMLAQLQAPSSALSCLRGPRLRLWARRERSVSCGPRQLAAEGFLVEPGLARLVDDPCAIPEGHLVWASCTPDRVQLCRSLSGGERLYLARLGPLVVFASSIRPLLAHPRLHRGLNEAVLDEVLHSGLTLFGPGTLHRGIDEVLAGCAVTLSDTIEPQRWLQDDVLRSPEGDLDQLGVAFREALIESVVEAAGPQRPVTVALSGGIDSSAIAAAAVEAFGADGVEAITYEFSDPEHSTEVHWARTVADHLGIGSHHVFGLDPRAYLEAIPEIIWRSESLTHWPKAFMLLVAREVARRGRDRYLTGFGIGSHTAYLADLARALERGIPPGLCLGHWRSARFGASAVPDWIGRLHPALEPPHPRLYYLLVQLLRQQGWISDPQRFFPEALRPLLQRPPSVPSAPGLERQPLERQLQLAAFAHLASCIDVTRSEKASRELGVYRISPAHFRRCIGYAYFPVQPTPRLWSADRSLRPGKLLLRRGFRGILPDEVLFRVKSWGDAVASDGWLRHGRTLMLAASPSFPADAERYGAGYAAAVRWWEAYAILATGLALRTWERMFIEMPVRDTPPTWRELWEARA